MKSSTTIDCRCKSCGALLARRDADGLSVRRGEFQLAITGEFTATVSCYRCKTLTIVSSRPPSPPSAPAARRPAA